MKTNIEVVSSFLAAAIWADGEFDEFEKEFVNDLSKDLEQPKLVEVLGKEIKATEAMSEEQLADYLEKASKNVDKEEREGVLALCLQLMCADAFLAATEVENFFSFAEFLGVNEDTANAMLDEFVEENEELIIED